MDRTLPRLASAFALVTGLLAAAGMATAQTPPRMATIVVTGLPAGLDMRLGARIPDCDGRSGSSTIGFTVPMVADTEVVLDPIEFNGLHGFIGRLVPVYRSAPTRVPLHTLCPTERTEFVAMVNGRQAGLPAVRQLHLADLFPTGDDLVVRTQPRASTLLIRNGNNETLSTLTRNVDQVVIATFQTPSKAPAQINNPSLALQFPAQPQRGFPLPDVVVRFFAEPFGNGSRACIEKDGRVACQQFLPTGVRPASLDGFECSAAAVQSGQVDDQGRTVAVFRFKLPMSLRVGEMELSVSANDVDLSSYTLNGAQRALDLLPWNAKNIPIFIQ